MQTFNEWELYTEFKTAAVGMSDIKATELWQEKYAKRAIADIIPTIKCILKNLKRNNKALRLTSGNENPMLYLDAEGYVNDAERASPPHYGAHGRSWPLANFLLETYFMFLPETASKFHKYFAEPIFVEPIEYSEDLPQRFATGEEMLNLIKKIEGSKNMGKLGFEPRS